MLGLDASPSVSSTALAVQSASVAPPVDPPGRAAAGFRNAPESQDDHGRCQRHVQKNAHRQDACSMSQPPMTGPAAVVIAVKPDQVPIALPRSLSSKEALIMDKLPGMRNAASNPCTALVHISSWMSDASPQAIEATVKTTTPVRNIRLRPNKSPSEPPALTVFAPIIVLMLFYGGSGRLR